MYIKLNMPSEPFSGQIVHFQAPCDCSPDAWALLINGEVYNILDTKGNMIPDSPGCAWKTGAIVSAVLDCENNYAFILNNSNYAPDGYGLGSTDSPIITNADLAVENGWYYYKPAVPPSFGFAHCSMFVVARNASNIFQYFFHPSIGCIVQRHIKTGSSTWTEAWINPPMELGVEYATTERWNRKTVYTALVNCGSLGSGEHTINTKFSVVSPIRSAATTGKRVLPMLYETARIDDYIRTTQVNEVDGKLQIKVLNGKNQSAATQTYVQVWYTKE